MKKYIYRFTEEELEDFLIKNPVPLEIVKREDNSVLVGVYEPIKGLKPVKTEEVKIEEKDFGPVEVEDFIIVPPWKKVIYINPGMAFGTGLHPTTQMCLSLLKRYVKEEISLLDVGTGSGILAIAGKFLGAGKVLGIDISEAAVRECKENAKRNNVEIECKLLDVCEIDEKFDIAVANLETDIFKKKKDCLKRVFKDELIISGIYGKKELEEVKELFKDFQIKEVLEKENWFSIVMEKPVI